MKRLLTFACLTLVSTACVDNTTGELFEDGTRTAEQAVVAVPEFRIENVGELPSDLLVNDIELSVSEIRFAPALGQDVAYSTREPMLVAFDIEGGEYVRTEDSVELPEPGRYIVSIRLEPLEGDSYRSFSVNGLVAESGKVAVQDDKYDGTPQPILLDEKDEDDQPGNLPSTKRDLQNIEWTPFRYESRRSVFYTFNDVELEHGEQYLTFNFDAANWGGAVIDSITKAVRNTAPESANEIDVTKTLESNGDDFQRLIETGSVQAHGGF